MASCNECIVLCSNMLLSASALYSSHQLFKDHRAPSVGLFLLGLSAGLCVMPFSSPYLTTLQTDLEWLGEILAPPLVAFGYLWLSEDRTTAHILLIGSCLLPPLRDWLSPDGLILTTRCLALSSLYCSLIVCLFVGNSLGALGFVALSLPSLLALRVKTQTSALIISPAYSEWLLKVSMTFGCLTSMRALKNYLLEVKGWHWH